VRRLFRGQNARWGFAQVIIGECQPCGSVSFVIKDSLLLSARQADTGREPPLCLPYLLHVASTKPVGAWGLLPTRMRSTKGREP
jgi:hypothetical protein